jgi:predicted transcriptional regulator
LLTVAGPTVRQIEIAAAVREHKTQAAAARALGISQTAVSEQYRKWLRATGQDTETLARDDAAYARGRADAIADLQESMARLEHLLGRVEAFEKRLPNVIRQALISADVHVKQVRISTRRIVDGGTHGSDQRRALAGKVATLEAGLTLLTDTPESSMLGLPAKQAERTSNGRSSLMEGRGQTRPRHAVSGPGS